MSGKRNSEKTKDEGSQKARGKEWYIYQRRQSRLKTSRKVQGPFLTRRCTGTEKESGRCSKLC